MTSSCGRSMASVASAMAAAVFRPIGSTTTPTSGRLLERRVAGSAIGHDRDVVGQPGQPVDRPLQQRALAEQRQERLRALGSAQRVEAGPAAAGQDDGVHAPPSLGARMAPIVAPRSAVEAQPAATTGSGSGRPASAARRAALSVRSHGRSRSGRPKWP